MMVKLSNFSCQNIITLEVTIDLNDQSSLTFKVSTEFVDQIFFSLEEITDLNDQNSVTEVSINFSRSYHIF